MIHCAKCQYANSTDQSYCQKCHANLLPGEGLGLRIVYLVVAGLFTAPGVFILMRMAQGDSVPALEGCALSSPVFWGLVVVVTPITGIVYAFRRTPPHERYLNRAKRHTALDAEQALADLNHALELAPPKVQSQMLKERAKVYQALGLRQQAARDQLASMQAGGAYEGSAALAGLAGIDADTYVVGLRSSAQEGILASGDALALGYCPKCKDAVVLDEKLRCKQHRRARIAQLRFAIPEDCDRIRAEILEHTRRTAHRERVRRAIPLAALVVSGGILYYVYGRPTLPEAVVSPTEVAPVENAPVAQPLPPLEFAEQGFRFQVPGDWERISAADRDTLLRTSLKGMDEAQAAYIGGVYHGGLGQCQDCAQIVLVVVNEPAINGTFTEEQFEAARQANQETMGDRLLGYNRVTVDGLPASESRHIGRSGETQLWELIIVPPKPGEVYLFSMSASRDDYPIYEEVFQAALDSLKIDSGLPQITAQAVLEPEIAAPAISIKAMVLKESINVRSGPGKDYDPIGVLEKGQEIDISGRNEAGDWLRLDGEEEAQAWVYAALVSLRGEVGELPVIAVEP